MELLQTDGVAALTKAKDRSDQFGHQSDQISDISREARSLVEKLELEAAINKQNAEEANQKSLQAYELAKNTLTLQQNISEELNSNIRQEVSESNLKFQATSKITNDALKRANEVYDDALTLFASVNALTAPDIKIDKLKKEAALANEEVRYEIF